MKKQFLILFAFISVLALSQVPQRFNKVIVTGDITSPKFIKTGSSADSVLLGNGLARSVNSLKTDTVSLSNRINAKATGSGTANGTNTGDETLTSIKTKLGAATAVSDGYLKYQDFADFSGKVSNATHTGDVTGSTALTLATVNSSVGTFNNVTINEKGLATSGGNVSYLTSAKAASTYLPLAGGTLTGALAGTLFNVSSSNNGTAASPLYTKILTANTTPLNEASIQFGSRLQNDYGSLIKFVVNGTVGNTPITALTLNPFGGGVFASTVTATQFNGSGAGLTGIQLPITLTTNGTSGAATFSGNVLNVPNYASTGIGGSYTASISSGSNTANPVVYSSLYTKNGTVYSSIIKGYIECTGSQGNTCTFNVSTYNGSTANLSIIGVGAQGTNIILGSGSTGSNVVMSFTNPVGSGGIGFTLIIHYTN